MRRVAFRFALRTGRLVSLVVLAALSCMLLVRFAPGYFSDTREMDGAYAHQARMDLDALQQSQGSVRSLIGSELFSWSHGSFGVSRHYEVPVSGLLHDRSLPSLALLVRGILLGWALAAAVALPLTARQTRRGEFAITLFSAVLLAVPAGVLATVAFLLNKGGPVLVLALLVAVRDFKLLYRLFGYVWRLPFVLHARAQGFSSPAIFRVHLLPVLQRELLALAMMSFVVAISALVPVEVIFSVPGIGQLAWNAAINRDMPVLVAVTIIMAACVGLAELFTQASRTAELLPCA